MPPQSCNQSNLAHLIRLLLCLLITFILQFSQRAAADSFCDYDEGLIGTKAIGFVNPFKLLKKEWDFEKGQCAVWTFADPKMSDPSQATLRQCAEFTPLPSKYIDVAPDTDLATANQQLVRNDYFSLLVFGILGNALKVELRDGSSTWVRVTDNWDAKEDLYILGDNPQISGRQPTETKYYTQPRLSTEASPPSYHGQVQADFFAHPYFKESRTKGYFDPDDIEAYAQGTLAFGFIYNVLAIIRDDKGTEWFEVEEHLEQGLEDWSDALSLPPDFQYPIQSDVIRKIYIPFRGQEGIIQTVFLPGPYCD